MILIVRLNVFEARQPHSIVWLAQRRGNHVIDYGRKLEDGVSTSESF
jgi:hypothetical protein